MWETVQEIQRLEQMIGQLQSVIGVMAVRLAELERTVELNWLDTKRESYEVME